ncbi:MAG: nucleoside phosphorylase [Bacteroidetes bacterium]|nr:nucleoside phosphorylase [Bacteroidota bacterium]MBS1617892.1 nucleoside phosphorylase [Bacteroidota bacterium]
MSYVIPESELIINPDGSVYHLHLRPEQIADTIITVGDPGRVKEVTKHFDSIEHTVQYREFLTQTGMMGLKRLTVISTGIGTDNIDIVFNELDALANIDLRTRMVKQDIKSLDIIRLGTSGAVSPEVELDSLLLSECAIGIEGLMTYYDQHASIQETLLAEAFRNHIHVAMPAIAPYAAFADQGLLERFDQMGRRGLTLTAPGFYAPQGRHLRYESKATELMGLIRSFRHLNYVVTNLEMETSGIYGLGKHLGHRCLSINAIVAQRVGNVFSKDAGKVVDRMIREALEIIVSS